MGEKIKENPFDMRLLMLPDRMHVIDNMDEKTRTPLPYMQLWEVKDGPVVIAMPSGDARIFYDGKWHAMDPWETVFNGHPMSFRMFEQKWPGLISVEEYLASLARPKAL